MHELFGQWSETPPTNVLLSLVARSLGIKWGQPTIEPLAGDGIPSELRNRPGLPIVRGRDPGLPKTAPVFDLNAMKRKNIERMVATAKKRGVKRV